jgi:hypothetical protein
MPAPVVQVKRGALSNLPGLRAGEPAFTTDSFDFYVGIDSTTNNNKFVGSHRYWRKETASRGSGVNLVESTSGSDFITLAAPASVGAAVTYYFPATQGINGTVLTNDGSGNLSWGSGSNNATFSGITTFSDTTDSTTKDNGAVVIEGGVGIEKSVNIGGNIYVAGLSTFNGLVVDNNGMNVSGYSTVYNLQITNNLGVSQTLDVDGYFRADSESVFSGIASFTNSTQSTTYDNGAVVLDGGLGVQKNVNVGGNLNVIGNVTIGGTFVSLKGQDVYIENKDIILGYTTSITPNDDTANHAGVAIASTVGSPLTSFAASGINTLPDTYKQLMWFKSGTLGFSTDAFAFNYGLAIGTTTMASGIRLAVGSGITMTDNAISATNMYGTFNGTFNGTVSGNVATATYADNAGISTQVKTVTASDSAGTYYVTFVDSHNGSATAETVYTDDGIYYNPGTNTFTTQHALFTGNVEVQGTLTGTATTSTRATLVDTTGTSTNADYYVTFVDTLAGQTSETLRVGAGLSVNPSDGSVKTRGILSVGNPGALTSYIKAGGGSNALYMYANGDVSFQAKAIVNEIRSSSNATTLITLSDLDATFARDIKVTGITTTGTFKLNGTSGIGITGISTSTTLAENSDSYLPTQKAVKAYVDAVDLTLGLNADGGGPSTVNTSQTLTISGTANEVETSVSGQTVTIGLPSTVNITTLLDVPTVEVTNLKAKDGTTSITITDGTGAVGFANSVTISGDLYVLGTTTEVNTSTLKVEDTLVDLGLVNSGGVLVPPSSDLNLDIGILLNWYSGSSKKASVFWDDSAQRVGIASDVTESTGVLSVNNWAAIEIGSLWVNDCAGQSEVISCTSGERFLNNITVDAGTF